MKNLSNKISTRLDWVDICRAIAIIFVFLGHWESIHLKSFAYSFHLKLFFLISGFFAYNCSKKYNFKEYFIKKFKTILIPMLLWMIIAFIYTHLDGNFSITDIFYIFSDIRRIEPNYWFFPTIFTISIIYYLLNKYIKRNYLILILSYLLIILFGKNGLFVISTPDNVFFNYLFANNICYYLFWYALGTISFDYINKFISNKDNKKSFNIIGCVCLFLSIILFFKNITEIHIIEKYVLTNSLLCSNYIIITSLINIISIIYISTFLINSSILKEIGKNTMSHMGLEFMTRYLLSTVIFELFGLAPLNINSTIGIIVFVVIQLIVHKYIIIFINKYFPILNGKKKEA